MPSHGQARQATAVMFVSTYDRTTDNYISATSSSKTTDYYKQASISVQMENTLFAKKVAASLLNLGRQSGTNVDHVRIVTDVDCDLQSRLSGLLKTTSMKNLAPF